MPNLVNVIGAFLASGAVDISSKVDFLRGILPDYIDEGYTGRQILNDLRDSGFRINNSLFYMVKRQVEETQNEFRILSYFPGSYVPGRLDFAVAEDFQSSEYKFIFRVKHINTDDGEPYYTHFGVGSDQYGDINSIRQMGRDYIEQFYPQYGDSEWSLELYGAMRRS